MTYPRCCRPCSQAFRRYAAFFTIWWPWHTRGKASISHRAIVPKKFPEWLPHLILPCNLRRPNLLVQWRNDGDGTAHAVKVSSKECDVGPHHRRGAIPARIRRRQRHSTAQPRRYFHLDSPSEARNWLGARKCDFGISRGTHPSEEVPRIHTDFVAISIARTASSGQSRKTRCMGEPARRVRTSGMRLNRRRSTSFRTPGPARNISKNWESHSTPGSHQPN